MAQNDLTQSAEEGAGLLWLPPELPVLHASAVDTAEFLAILTEAMTAPIKEGRGRDMEWVQLPTTESYGTVVVDLLGGTTMGRQELKEPAPGVS